MDEEDIVVKSLKEQLGKEILIKIKGDRQLRGVLAGIDGHMNLVLRDCEEVMPDGVVRSLGAVILRGDNLLLISPIGE